MLTGGSAVPFALAALSQPEWSPADIPNLLDWRQPAELTAYSEGESITLWTQIGSPYPAFATDGANPQPTARHNVLNGHSVARFAYGQWLIAQSGVTCGPQQSLAIVVKPNDTQTRCQFDAHYDATNRSLIKLETFGGDNTEYAYVVNTGGGSVYSSKSITAAWHIVIATIDDDTVTVYVDNVAGTPAVNSGDKQTGSTSRHLGVNFAGNRPFVGDIAEFLFYDHLLTADERNSLHAYLATKYAL